jgi:hypothetical protein
VSLVLLLTKNSKFYKPLMSGDLMDTNQPETGFCAVCSDWLVEEGWQEDGTYFCPTCLEFRNVELVWRQHEGLVQDTTEKFS